MNEWFLFLVAFITVDIFILLYIFVFRKKKGFSDAERKKMMAYYQKIKTEKDSKLAILEADKLLDLLLKKKGYSGSLGEKMKRADKLFSDSNAVWNAHKLRNRLAHELEVQCSPDEFQRAIRGFEKAYKDMGLLS